MVCSNNEVSLQPLFGSYHCFRLELETLKAFVQVQKSMEILNLSGCLIAISRFKIALSQWYKLIVRLSVEVFLVCQSYPEILLEPKDEKSRKLFQHLRKFLSFSTAKCELYFMEFLSKPLQQCSIKAKSPRNSACNSLQQSNPILDL